MRRSNVTGAYESDICPASSTCLPRAHLARDLRPLDHRQVGEPEDEVAVPQALHEVGQLAVAAARVAGRFRVQAWKREDAGLI